MRKLYKFALFILLLPGHIFISGEEIEVNKTKAPEKYILGRIGFMQNFNSEGNTTESEVTIGVESYGDAFYKLCSSDGESIVKGGLLNEGLNIIGFPVEFITGENSGVFFLFTKNGKQITGKQIILLSDKIETSDMNPEIEDGGAVSDRYKHEITVTGEDNRFNDYAARITRDSFTGDYPGLNQGIPILPILYLFVSKIVRSIKKKKRDPVSLFSETELYIKQKKDKGKSTLIKLRILISEM